jgi:hypothetical protein
MELVFLYPFASGTSDRLVLEMSEDIVIAIHKLGAYVERIPPEAIKASHQDQIMKRLAMILIQLDGFKEGGSF